MKSHLIFNPGIYRGNPRSRPTQTCSVFTFFFSLPVTTGGSFRSAVRSLFKYYTMFAESTWLSNLGARGAAVWLYTLWMIQTDLFTLSALQYVCSCRPVGVFPIQTLVCCLTFLLLLVKDINDSVMSYGSTTFLFPLIYFADVF